jgi:preprotein translocase subunit SecG
MKTTLDIAQIVIAVALVTAILFQIKGGGLGGIFGQSDSVYRTKRGIDRWLFLGTIVLTIIFVILSMISMLYTG